MGSVYEAEQRDTHTRVAVKVIHDRLLTEDKGAVRRFRCEARAASAVGSRHIVQVLDAGDEEATGLPYLVMEYLPGEDLQQTIDRIAPLAPSVPRTLVKPPSTPPEVRAEIAETAEVTSRSALDFLVRVWKQPKVGSTHYARRLGRELRCVYCYGGNDKLTGELSMSRTERTAAGTTS